MQKFCSTGALTNYAMEPLWMYRFIIKLYTYYDIRFTTPRAREKSDMLFDYALHIKQYNVWIVLLLTIVGSFLIANTM